MAMSIFFSEGDGIVDDRFALSLNLPDTNGGTISINGQTQVAGLPAVVVATSVTVPVAPASGLVYFNVQIDPANGAATLYQSTSANPPVVSSTNGTSLCRTIYTGTISPTQTDPALDAGTTPDDPSGYP